MTDTRAEMPELPDVLSVNVADASRLIGISRRQMYVLIAAGEIATTQIPSPNAKGRRQAKVRVIEIEELKAFLRRNRQETR